jgi:hypothetical protein
MKRLTRNVVTLPARRNSDVVAAAPGIILNVDIRPSIREEIAAVSMRMIALQAATLKVATEHGQALNLQTALIERLNRLSRLANGLPAVDEAGSPR